MFIITDNIFLLFYVIMKSFYSKLRYNAWKKNVEFNPKSIVPEQLTKGYGLYGKTPDNKDPRSTYQLFSNTIVYPFVMFKNVVKFPFIYLTAKKYNFTDEDVFNFVHETCLIFSVNVRDNISSFSCQQNYNLPLYKLFSPEKIVIKFNIQKKSIISTNNNELNNNDLIIILWHIITFIVHPMIHVHAEKSALEIQNKRIYILNSSVHYVSSLHNGLLFAHFSPLGKSMFRVTDDVDINKLYPKWTNQENVIYLDYDVKKYENFPFYRFLYDGYKILTKLLHNYPIQEIDTDSFFMNIVLHGLDHGNVHDILSKNLKLSNNGSKSLKSVFQMYIYTQVWLPYHENKYNSNKMSKNDELFFSDYYNQLKTLPNSEKYVHKLINSTSF